jgi:DNA-binding NarL/FixJ family response regulator
LVVHLFRDATHKKQNERFAKHVLNAVTLVQEEGGVSPARGGETESRAKDLTDRELEVLSLLAQGSSTRDVAQALSISPSTARNHIQNILHKLNVHSRLEAVAYAFEHGLVSKN